MIEIEKWIKKNESFGLKLPDGWFGRPYDNQHKITWMQERPNKLIIELDEQLFLIFTKPTVVEPSGKDLTISGFKQLSFDRQGYGDMKAHCNLFRSGVVTFVSLP